MTTKELIRKRTVLRNKIAEKERALRSMEQLRCPYCAEQIRQELKVIREQEQKVSWEIYDREYPARA